MSKGYDGYWLWEDIVEEARPPCEPSYGRGAEWWAMRSLHAYYPYGNKKRLWQGMDPEIESAHIIALLDFEFDFSRQYGRTDAFSEDLRIVRSFGERLSGFDRERFECLIQDCTEPFSACNRKSLNANGVYALYRYPDDLLPQYIGEGNIGNAFARRHRLFWGSHEIHVKYFQQPDLTSKKGSERAEQVLLSVFNPPGNHYIEVFHPDELGLVA